MEEVGQRFLDQAQPLVRWAASTMQGRQLPFSSTSTRQVSMELQTFASKPGRR